MTHLLDTTALLAHFLDENGAGQVDSLLALGPDRIALAAPTWVELHIRLREIIGEGPEMEAVFHDYTGVLTRLLPVDEAATRAAIGLRAVTPGRLPLSDALIAGAAFATGLTLVHRDAHFDTVPGLELLRLPDK